MTIAVLVVLAGLIVGVTIEVLLSRRHRGSSMNGGPGGTRVGDDERRLPSPPTLPEPRFIDDGEGFRILGPMEFDDPGPGSWEEPLTDGDDEVDDLD